MTNKEIWGIIKLNMEANNFIPINIDIESSYDYNYFQIKGIRNWRFGVYINSYYMEGTTIGEAIQFFGIHKDNIDKFRPSSAVWLVEETIDSFSKDEYGSLVTMQSIEMLKSIKYHPIFAYLYDAYGEEFTFKKHLFLQWFCQRVYWKVYWIKRRFKKW